MKVQDFAYRVATRTMQLLEQTQHYKISEDTQKQVLEQVLSELEQLIKG